MVPQEIPAQAAIGVPTTKTPDRTVARATGRLSWPQAMAGQGLAVTAAVDGVVMFDDHVEVGKWRVSGRCSRTASRDTPRLNGVCGGWPIPSWSSRELPNKK